MLTFGLPCMRQEAGERRDFLPSFVARLEKLGAQVVLEEGYGFGMGYGKEDYRRLAPRVRFASHDEVYRQDYVLILRYPGEDELRLMRPGACLIAMIHYPTRPERVKFLKERGLEAISLDSVKDDTGRRLVENLQAVAWNGVEVAFKVLREQYPAPGFEDPRRPPIRVTLLGAGAVGGHVVRAVARYGDIDLRARLAEGGVPGVLTTVVDYDVASLEEVMIDILSQTDLLIDATQRVDSTKCVIPNRWIGHMPRHAVLLDLSVDPYDCSKSPPLVKGIEGIPQGNLDQYIFRPDDPAFERLPACVDTTHRRTSVSCYSWPGIYPQACMEVYGRQLSPLMRTIIEAGGVENINPQGKYFERAIARAMLSHWQAEE